MSGRDPKPGSPERLFIEDVAAEWGDNGQVTVTLHLAYDPWCCNGAHELVDATKAACHAIEESQSSGWRPTEIEEENP